MEIVEWIEPTAYDVLARAHELLQRGWCRKAFARGSGGEVVDEFGPAAVEFCGTGAMDRAAGDLRASVVVQAAAWVCLFGCLQERNRMPFWNDAPERTHAEVLALFARAARVAREAGEK